ncbi:MAG TPA: YicC family protein [Bacteroidales bacterium]|jgi:uncharacterized protein (TIGR00255 family)|nr:YicC family protein [Bacteroidales bacterium]MDD4394937.1 YicC family protein [Bacteroidales bacterium]HNW67619.1 YicC family protein [Bacteroidales bacterium]HPT51737.1 YicC family protein [Bacteroidales bacterium]
MIKSMTGFGKTNLAIPSKSIIVEIRTLNSKQLDLSTRIAPLFRDKENEIRSIVAQRLERGKIDVAVYLEKNETAPLTVNKSLAKNYFDELTALSLELQNPVPSDLFIQVLRMPDVMTSDKEELSEELWEQLRQAVEETCQKTDNFRMNEGKVLAADFENRVKLIDSYIDKITPYETQRVANQKNKFLASFAELQLKDKYDPNRLEQEMIFFVEKLDITEEKVRLRKHCAYFLETMAEKESKGKKMGFIVQEMGREVNTIGSKCNDFNIQQIVVQMKDEVEKMKEQLANIL